MKCSVLIFYNVQPEPCYTEPAAQGLRQRHTELLAVGDQVSRLLPAWVQEVLSEPIAAEQIGRLQYGDSLEKLTPARVRIALGAAEAAIALQGMVFGFSRRNQCQVAVLDGQKEVVFTAKRSTPVRHIVERMGRETGFPYPVAEEIWKSILAFLRQGGRMPGIKTSRLDI